MFYISLLVDSSVHVSQLTQGITAAAAATDDSFTLVIRVLLENDGELIEQSCLPNTDEFRLLFA